MHTLLATILLAFSAPKGQPVFHDCTMPRIHYIADTVYVFANQIGPITIHARSSEIIRHEGCSACLAGKSGTEMIGEPSDSEGVCLSELTVRATQHNQRARYFTAPTQ
jgi:hypothetical protein